MRHKTSLPFDTSSNDSHGSSPEAPLGSGSRSAAAAPTPGRQALSRRGHFKSRLGCFNCKRRRVKCNELRPECSPCRRLGLTCAYPASVASSSTPIHAAPSTLNLEDLRFYHRFLTTAFPTLPLRGGQVWSQAAAMSHSYEYLAHAVLGLGASHLSQNGNTDYTAQALQHRVVAIRLVNKQLDHPPKSPADADALLATIVCLVTQSSLMSDSMVDYLTMTRGANLVASTIVPDYQVSIFHAFTPEGHLASLTSMVCELPKDLQLIDDFRSSVTKLEPICQKPCELEYLAALVRCIEALPWKGFVVLFTLPFCFSNEEFLSFINPDNHAGHLLVIHMFLLDYILGQFCIAPSDEPPCPGRKNVIVSWTKNMAKTLPRDCQEYIQWPLHYCEVLSRQDARYLLSP
ncbi:Sterol uptake control protein 2 [Tolypocladium ophioglossoides CBS 100239]|uniref:Sterol uptake control protein 2 n=1 Tax=Tolypocladium ophioglossoides (strain CBS 100239) TaxID=1163406 RepID=A0A0L0NM33_TOLOC|nr:Sterol uptake control protein 2 [Tolypocladium ophioglossoides CBS 100239]